MRVHILVRHHRRSVVKVEEVVSVHESKADALKAMFNKNAIHESRQPYLYRVISKKLL